MGVQVKVCGLRTPEQAALAVRLGVAAVGVNVWPGSPRAVSLDTAAAVLEAVPRGKRVCVDVAPERGKLEQALALGFDVFQIHFEPHREALRVWLDVVGRERLWLAPKWPPQTPFPAALLEEGETLLVDAYRADAFGGTGRVGDWDAFAALRAAYPLKRWVLAGGLSPENIAEALRRSGADWVDVNSGIEDAPGVKNEERLREFLALCRSHKPPAPGE